MNESGKMKLHSLLFDGEKELGNVKFFPGTGRGLTSDELAGAAADALKCAVDAWQAGAASCPPVTGMEKRQLVG
jgi:hypothetical protein